MNNTFAGGVLFCVKELILQDNLLEKAKKLLLNSELTEEHMLEAVELDKDTDGTDYLKKFITNIYRYQNTSSMEILRKIINYSIGTQALTKAEVNELIATLNNQGYEITKMD